MFHWYRNSSVCYAHLYNYEIADFDVAELEKCEWFFRGWTLQELIAPLKVDFYNKDWQRFATKSNRDVCQAISKITKIDNKFLLGSDLDSASIAKRMSWAAKRKSTRTEDTAYSLLGLFDISMPLLYGEGSKAFRRLQEEIMKTHPEDHSLYAWGIPVAECSIEVGEKATQVSKENIDDQLASPEPLCGMLAKSPLDFEFSRNYSPVFWAGQFYMSLWNNVTPASYPAAVGKGMKIELPLNSRPLFYYQFDQIPLSQIRFGYYALLLCQDDTDDTITPCLPLVRWGSGYYARTRELYLDRNFNLSQKPQLGIFDMKFNLTIAPERKPRIRAGDVVLRSVLDLRTSAHIKGQSYNVNIRQRVVVECDEVVRVKDIVGRYYSKTFKDAFGAPENWCIVLGRAKADGNSYPVFQAGIVALCGPNVDESIEEFICEKVFQSPSDEFTFDLEYLPKITVRVERRTLPNGNELSNIVDIVDVAVTNRSIQEEKTDTASQHMLPRPHMEVYLPARYNSPF